MICYDNTQRELEYYLMETQAVFNKLLSSMNGQAIIKPCLDLGFPHDVIRISGGFATGAYVTWLSSEPIIPVDTCVNVCSCSFFELENDIKSIFHEEIFKKLNEKLQQGIYLSNFHRGNHFIAYVESINTKKRYLLLHSSASEFKNNFNGLYPVADNWFYDQIQIYTDGKRYIRYIKGKDAEIFYNISENLVRFNENRHEFIAQILLRKVSRIHNVSHYHHYLMPDPNSVVMGSHIVSKAQVAPILTIPGENIYIVEFNSAKDKELYVDERRFLTPHGWGKRHKSTPQISIDVKAQTFKLDDTSYKIKFGESLRAHSMLELRDFMTSSKSRKQSFFEHMDKMYNYKLIDEMKQIASYNKDGVIIW